jgi:hypothetical protein
VVVSLSLKQKIRLAVSMGCLLCSAVASAQDRAEETVSLGGHVFRIPRKYLASPMPWIPREGFSVFKNPNVPMRKLEIVGVDDSLVACRIFRPEDNLHSEVCSAANLGNARSFVAQDRLLKIDLENHSEYRVSSKSEKHALTIASCSFYDKKYICKSMNNYQNLIYSFIVRDKDIGRLPKIWRSIERRLASWEVR